MRARIHASYGLVAPDACPHATCPVAANVLGLWLRVVRISAERLSVAGQAHDILASWLTRIAEEHYLTRSGIGCNIQAQDNTNQREGRMETSTTSHGSCGTGQIVTAHGFRHVVQFVLK